jgi:hypothetical protein
MTGSGAQKYGAAEGNEILSKETEMRQAYAICLMLSLAAACGVASAQERSASTRAVADSAAD